MMQTDVRWDLDIKTLAERNLRLRLGRMPVRSQGTIAVNTCTIRSFGYHREQKRPGNYLLLQKPIPTYALYGEFLSATESDPVHHETIRERSSKHGWDIKLHRHEALSQFFLFETPGVQVQAGEVAFRTTGPTILCVPPMVTHGFQFPKDIVGDVLSFPLEQLEDTARNRLSVFTQGKPRVMTPTPTLNFDGVRQITRHLARAFHAFEADRTELLQHLIQTLLIYLTAGQPQHIAPATGGIDLTKHEQQCQTFCKLIEQKYTSDAAVGWYAHALGVSPPHLTRISKRILGATPNDLITRRRMIEAERLLKFTLHPIADIALRVGYRDAPYFNRAFKRWHGVSPGVFRRTQSV